MTQITRADSPIDEPAAAVPSLDGAVGDTVEPPLVNVGIQEPIGGADWRMEQTLGELQEHIHRLQVALLSTDDPNRERVQGTPADERQLQLVMTDAVEKLGAVQAKGFPAAHDDLIGTFVACGRVTDHALRAEVREGRIFAGVTGIATWMAALGELVGVGSTDDNCTSRDEATMSSTSDVLEEAYDICIS